MGQDDDWLGLHVGTDVALSNTIAREIIHAGLTNTTFIEQATDGFAEYGERRAVDARRSAEVTGLHAEAIRELAHTYARATGPSCAGHSASPSTTSRSTTCSP